MADERSIKTIYLNAEAFARGTLSGTTWVPASNLVFYRGAQSLIRAHLMMNDGATYFKPPAGCTWLAGFDNTFATDHPDLVVSENAQFIAGDWADADFDNGKVCWRMDWTSAALKSALANSPLLQGWMCLWMTPTGGKPSLVAQWTAVVNNIAVDPTTAVAQDGISFVQLDMYNADRNELMHPTGGYYSLRNAIARLKNTTIGKYQTIHLEGPENAPQIVYGLGEEE